MKRFGLFGFFCGIALFVLVGAKITTDRLQIGNKVAEDIFIEFDIGTASNPLLKWNNASGALEFSNDGTNFFEIGSGTGGGGSGGLNDLENPGFESGTTGYTVSGGSFDTTTAAGSVGEGGQSGRWTGNDTDTFDTNAVSFSNRIQGTACLARFSYRWDTGVANTMNFKVFDGTNDITAPIDLNVPPTGQWARAEVGFVCPTSGVFGIRLTCATGGGACGEILLDSMHLGEDFRRGVLGDTAEIIAHAEMEHDAGSCVWATTSAAPAAFTPVAACLDNVTVRSNPSGLIDTATDDLPRLNFTSLPAGKYLVSVTFSAKNDTNNNNAEFALNDGTDTRGFQSQEYQTEEAYTQFTLQAVFEYSTKQTNHHFEIFGGREVSGTTTLANFDESYHINWIVTRYPTQSPRDTVTIESQDFLINANIGGSSNTTITTSTVSSYTGIENGDVDLVANQGSSPVGIACDGVVENAVGNTTCSGANEEMGVVFNAPYKGLYYACASFTNEAGSGASGNINNYFKLVQTANNDDTSILQDGNQRIGTRSNVDNEAPAFPVNVCGIFDLPPGKATIRLYHTSSITGTIFSNLIYTDRLGAANGDRDVAFTVIPLKQNFPQSVVLQNVQTGATADCTNGSNVCDGNAGTLTCTLGSGTSECDFVEAYFKRQGNTVEVWGELDVRNTTSGVSSEYTLSIPILRTSNFTRGKATGFAMPNNDGAIVEDCAWVVYGETSSTDKVQFRGDCASNAKRTQNFRFLYKLD